MSEWYVLGLSANPTPGYPDQTRALAARLLDLADLADHNTSRLRRVAADDGELRMEGEYAPKFRQALAELPDELAKLGRAHRGCGDALRGFASSLEQAKVKAGTALRQGRDADARYQGALRELRSLLPADRQAMVSSGLGLSPVVLAAATAGLDGGTRTQVEIVARRARSAEADRDLARRLADQAAELRGDAERRCADGIRQALVGSGIRNRSWWQAAWDTVSAPFRSWDDFVGLCRTVALVAGIVALFVSGPIGWALLAAALVAGAVVFANTLSKYARGQASLTDVALDALYLLPGEAGVIRLAELGRGALEMAQGLRTAGMAIPGALRNLESVAVAIRSAIADLRQSAIPFGRRVVCADPVDVATGEMVLQQTDVELAGVLPLVLTRAHVSSYRAGRWFGRSWASTLDQRLEVDPTGVFYAAPDGMLLVYPTPSGDAPTLPAEGPRHPLTRTAGGYAIADPERGHTLHFTATGDVDATVLPLTAVTDRNGARIDLDYDARGTLTQIRHSGGYQIGVETTGGLITALRLLAPDRQAERNDMRPGQVLVRYGYGTGGLLTEVTNSSGLPLRFEYDSDGRITRWRDRNDTWYRYAYDDHGRVVRTSGAAGCLDGTFAYDLENHLTAVTDSLGHTTIFHLNDAVQVVREVDPLGHATTSRWDRYDRLLARTDPLGRTTRYAYDEAGNLTRVIRPDGSQATAVYNDLRLPVTITDPDGAVWRHAYDERGNLTGVTDPMGATTAYAYDERGHRTAVTDALGYVRRIQTNAAGLPIAVTDPLGATTRWARDSFGRVVAVTDPLGGTTRFDWTVEGKLARRILPDGATDRWAYDAEGNLTEHVDPLGQVTCTEITHFDLPAARTTPDGARLVLSYDTELRLVAVTNPQGLVWRYEYDPAGNLVGETDFNGRVLTYTYDAAGQLTARTNGAGQSTRYTHDQLGNLVEQRSGDTVTMFAYDLAGRLARASNPDADLAFERDLLGRALAETCNGRTITSSYDALGRRVHRRTPSGADSTWEYDPNDQPLALHTAGQSLRFAYDPAGREVERRLDTGAALTQAWDANHRLRSQILTAAWTDDARPASARAARLVQRRTYSYRPDGYLTGIDDQLSGRRRFDLDSVGRVTAVHGAGWTERYAYDLAGNLTDATWPIPSQAAASPDSDTQGERTYTGTLIRRAGNIRYEHDVQGRVKLRQLRRLSAKPRTWRYTWDADDRLTGVVTPDGQQWRYLYDPFGRRIAKQRIAADGTTVAEQVDFTWDGTVLAEQTHNDWRPDGSEPAGSRTTTWDWQPGSFRPLTQTQRSSLRDAPQQWVDEQFHAIVADQVGTPAELVDSDGNVAWQPRSSLWGVAISRTQGTTECPLRFPGQYFDDETQLHYNYYRYYDPTDGRYQSSDPIGLAAAPNPHAHVANPLSWVDPLGLGPCRIDGTLLRDGLARGAEQPGSYISIRSRITAAQLPNSGRIRYVPPKEYKSSNPLPRSERRGYIDRFGNEWVRGPSRTEGQPFEWDIQLSRQGRAMLGWASREGRHINVDLYGRVTHS